MKTLAVVTRSGYVESMHQGCICVVDAQGRVLYQKGDIETRIFFRSSAKPLQVIPFIQSGAAEALGFTLKEISLACSSHSGERDHQQTALGMLRHVGLDEKDLHCGTMVPYNKEEEERLIESGEKPTRLHASCSGKHAAMLALSKYWNLDISYYENISHPIQQEVLKVISEFADEEPKTIPTGTDGCGLPIYMLPIHKIALSYARLTMFAQDRNSRYHHTCKTIFDAMTHYPEMVAGQREFDTELMQTTGDKLIGKIGAEAVYCLGIKDDSLGICIKIADGNERAVYPVVMQLLRELHILDDSEYERLKAWHITGLMNNNEEHIGDIVPVFHLKDEIHLGDKLGDNGDVKGTNESKEPSP